MQSGIKSMYQTNLLISFSKRGALLGEGRKRYEDWQAHMLRLYSLGPTQTWSLFI
jgi:hypothetical protein